MTRCRHFFFQGHPAYEYEQQRAVVEGGPLARQRLIVVGKRAYSLTVSSAQVGLLREHAPRFFDSFRLSNAPPPTPVPDDFEDGDDELRETDPPPVPKRDKRGRLALRASPLPSRAAL
jgi:hypothetical protein